MVEKIFKNLEKKKQIKKNHFVEEIEQNKFMSEKHKKICTTLD